MAVTYEVCQLRGGGATFKKERTGALEKIIKTHTTKWSVLASGIADPSEVDEVMAGNAPGLPSLDSSVYSDKETGQIFPYFNLRKKTVRRDDSNAYRFVVDLEYSDESGEQEPQDKPDNPEDLCPQVSYSSEEKAYTLWSDYAGDPVLLPTGNFHGEAVLGSAPVIVITHKQYENSFDVDDQRDLLFKTNSVDFAGYGPNHALITAINWQPVNVPVNDPNDPDATFATNEVTYTIKCVEFPYEYLDSDSETVETKQVGWEVIRPLIDTSFLKAANDITTRKDFVPKDGNSIGNCYIKEDGTAHQATNQPGYGVAPPAKFYLKYPNTPFNFLRSC